MESLRYSVWVGGVHSSETNEFIDAIDIASDYWDRGYDTAIVVDNWSDNPSTIDSRYGYSIFIGDRQVNTFLKPYSKALEMVRAYSFDGETYFVATTNQPFNLFLQKLFPQD